MKNYQALWENFIQARRIELLYEINGKIINFFDNMQIIDIQDENENRKFITVKFEEQNILLYYWQAQNFLAFIINRTTDEAFNPLKEQLTEDSKIGFRHIDSLLDTKSTTTEREKIGDLMKEFFQKNRV